MSTILVISDLHCPVQHPKAFDFLKELKKTMKPDIIVSIGDEAEMHQFSKWLKDPDAPGVEDEIDLTIEELQKFYKLFPNLKICKSNHTHRFLKRAHEAGLSRRMIKTEKEVLQAPKGWEWEDKILIDDILFMHGEESSDPIKLIKQYRMNVVVGHAHTKGAVTYQNNGIQQNWCLQTGCLVDVDSYALRYTKAHMDKPVLGTGVIVDGIPFFIPME
jgi:predicted phosphodiesterase